MAKDELALQTVGFLVEDAQLRIIKDAITSLEAWMLLKEYFVRDSSVGKVALVKNLSKLELSEDGDMRQHLVEFEALFEKMENVGCKMDEDMKAAFILASLPQSHESIVSLIQGRLDAFTTNFENEAVRRV
ncbi:uncharacterized protein LOC115260757 [Aedes albopictus]|uniref:Retrovirus-related Pol polyprotein from transposon TNT 1-94 n=1 Tax=Aedes albopictus TaxID=7160 RepID=A0ABM1Y462_AEDAL|nr:uncharacterized protein LOC115260757 [Aedes albopictus]